MNKDTFIAAINQATLLQNCYTDKKRMVAMWDMLYDELKGERDQDLITALKRIGKSDKTINYFNIIALINEGKYKSWKGTGPFNPPSKEDKEAIKKTIDKLKGNWNEAG